MKTPAYCPIRTNSLALRIAICLGWLLITLWSHEAPAQDAVPFDIYGRPLADALGPILYRQDGENWIATHADGSQEAAPPIVMCGPTAPPENSVASGYQLDPYAAYRVGSYPYSVAIGDVTGDGHADVLMTTTSYFDPVNDYSLFLFPQQASGTLGAPLRFPYLVQTHLAGIVLADLNEDGIFDVIVGHSTGITVFLADGHGSLRPGVVTLGVEGTLLAASDVDRDGHVDIISVGQNGGTIFYGDGQGGFSQTIHLTTNAHGINDLEIADLNGDGFADLAVLDGERSPTVNLSVHRHDGVGAFVSPPDTYSVDPSLWRGGIGVGDVSGDRLNDVVVSRPMNSPTWLWIMAQDGSGRLASPTTITSYDIPQPVQGADLDGDGREDIVVLHGGWNRVGVYLQKPGGGLAAETLYKIPYASGYPPQSLAVGDFTSDGCADVAIADYNDGLVVLHGRGCVPHCQPGGCDDLNPCTDDSCDPTTGCVHANNTAPCDDGNACTTHDTCRDGECDGGGPNTCAGTFGMFTSSSGVKVFNADTDTVIGTISIGATKDCSINADQTFGFVVDTLHNVWVIDLTRTPPRLASGVNPIRISCAGVDTTISPDQRYLLVCGGTGEPLSVVDIALRQEIGTVPLYGDCSSVEACTNGSVLVTSLNDRNIRRYEFDSDGNLSDTGDELGIGSSPLNDAVNSICSPDGSSGIFLAKSAVISFGVPGLDQGDTRALSGFAFSGAINRAGDRVFLRKINGVVAYEYNSTTGSVGVSPLFSIPLTNADAFVGVDEIAVHPDGTRFYTLGFDGTVGYKMGVLSTQSGQLVRAIPTGANIPRAVCFPSMECAPGAPSQCDDGDACTTDGCDALGRCVHTNNTSPCNDGNACTEGDACVAGTCQPGTPVVCNDSNSCTDDTCDSSTGCVYTNNTSPCDDGNACTTNDTCGVGTCDPGVPVICNDANLCTTDTCDPSSGCVYTNNRNPCDDGNACTTGDACDGGVCHAGGPTNCDDGNCCTIDSCSPATGCIHVANMAAPVFTAQPSLGGAVLWPPNHGYADFALASTGAAASSTCGIASIQFASCSSSQTENGTGTGDGNSMRDCVYEPDALHLRAERDGACSPIGRVYTTSLVAVDVCENSTTSNPVDVGVWHDRGNPPAGVTIVGANGSNQSDFRAGANGTYGADCGAGGPFANGTVHDYSDADPEMEIAQQAAVNVNDLRLEKGASNLELTWGAPVQIGQVTRFHVWRLDLATLFWSRVAEVSKQTSSYQDLSLNDGSNWQYKVTAVIK